jgi:hypothetical protein
MRILTRALNTLKTELLPSNIYKFSSYLTGNTYVSATRTNRIMLFTEKISVYGENYTKHTNTLCGQQVVHMATTGR